MITIFTTTKDFNGRNRVNQLNAIRSWLCSFYKPQVIIFGKSAGIEELGKHENLIMLEQVRVSETGAPFADEMFNVISEIAKFDICCYVNADILLPRSFFDNVIRIHKKLSNKYLVVGARVDVDVDVLLDFSDNWEDVFTEKYKHLFKPHPPFGSDYFVFPKQQYGKGKMSHLLIGRPGWDLWMIYNARKNRFKTIDLTDSSAVYHQNHDYSHKKEPGKHVSQDAEAILNLRDIPERHKYLYKLNACNYLYINNQLEKSFSRHDYNTYMAIEKALGFYTRYSTFEIQLDHLRLKIRNNIFLKLLFAAKRKFNIGAGRSGYEGGWLNTDKGLLDITKQKDWKKFLRFLKLDNIFAEHVWEHLSDVDTSLANENCFRFLKRGGILRLAVPDGYNPDKAYIEHVRPGGIGPGAEDHKILYNYKIMKDRLEKVGFKVDLLEYWDENGEFHFVNWSDDGGRIIRSKRYDQRNKGGKLYYTSLIVDAIKP